MVILIKFQISRILNKRNGRGILNLGDGSKFVGIWKNNMRVNNNIQFVNQKLEWTWLHLQKRWNFGLSWLLVE
jgi:hypothetical protein